VVKKLSSDQLQARKEKAVRFVRDVLGDPDRAEEVAGESLEDYAQRRKIQVTNPTKRRKVVMATKRQLEEQIQELEQENEELQDTLDAVQDLVGGDEDEEDEEDPD
jgi:cell shape-determining protein MreC